MTGTCLGYDVDAAFMSSQQQPKSMKAAFMRYDLRREVPW